MTFVEIESKRRPCSFLSNNVKNDVNTVHFYPSLVSLVVSQTKQGEKKEFSTCLNIGAFTDGEPGGGRNYENYLQLSKIRNQESSWGGTEL